MGKYRAQFSLPGHLFGTIRVYDDDDPVVQHRVSSGMLVRVDEPKAKRATRSPAARNPSGEPIAPKAKRSPRKRQAEPEPEAVTEPEPQPEAEGSREEPPLAPDASSVQTSWQISD